MAAAEVIQLAGMRIDIAETPAQFPLGERGQRPVKFTVYDWAALNTLKKEKVPGCLVKGSSVHIAWELHSVICRLLGCPGALDNAYKTRCAASVPIPGKDRCTELGLSTLRRDYQAEDVVYLMRRSYGLLGETPRSGKCLILIYVCELVASKRVLIVCNALGTYVWAREIAKWSKQSATLLFGLGAADVRQFCAPCEGMGCKLCNNKGETRIKAERLQCVEESRVWNDVSEAQQAKYEAALTVWSAKETARFEKWLAGKRDKCFKPLQRPVAPLGKRRVARYCPVPARYICPVHPDEVDNHARWCNQCKALVNAVVREARWLIVSYDTLGNRTEEADDGHLYVREDLPGWGRTLGALEVNTLILSESHKLGAWKPTKKTDEKQNRVDRVRALAEPIERVYCESGTATSGEAIGLFSQLCILSRGLWS